MDFVITNAGINAILAAQPPTPSGPAIQIVKFKVSDAFGYTPNPAATALPGTLVGNPLGYASINYTRINNDTAEWTLELSENIGNWDFGSIGLYVDDPTSGVADDLILFAYAAFPGLVPKLDTSSGNANKIVIRARCTYTNLAPVVEFNVNPMASANIVELAGVHNLVSSSSSGANAYLCGNIDESGKNVLVFKRDTNTWSLNDFNKIISGSVVSSPAATAFQISSPTIGTLLSDFAIGRYFIQFTSGAHIGQVRQITSQSTNTAIWTESLASAPSVGDTFEIYQSTISSGGGGGGGGGTSDYVKIIATAGQTVFNCAPISAANCIVTLGSAIQPPDPTFYSVTGPSQITFTAPGIALGTPVYFIERTLGSTNVITGGTTGQVLQKVSNADGDYNWATVAVPSGQNAYEGIVSVDSGDGFQYIFNLSSVDANNCFVFVGVGFQPPAPGVYSVTGPNEITFAPGSGVPAGVTVHFMERTLIYSSVVAGGNTNQVLAKNSNTNGDYSWKDGVDVWNPILASLKRASMSFPRAVIRSSMSSLSISTSSTDFRWRGGVNGPDGKIYCIPFTENVIAIIDPVAGTATTSNMGASLTGSSKWFGGVLGSDGKIYGIPNDATNILIIDVDAGTASRSNLGATITGTGNWSGGVLAPNGKIYCIPRNASDILIIDTIAGTASYMGESFVGSNKWRGGVLGTDGKIYGIPHNASTVLVIDPVADTATTTNFGLTLSDANKWSGGALGFDGKIYCAPFDSTDILIIDTVSQTAQRSYLTATMIGSSKWSSAVAGSDGKIYCIPWDSADILVIDVARQIAVRDTSATYLDSEKWYGGVLGIDGVIYAIPHSQSNPIFPTTPNQARFLRIWTATSTPLPADVVMSPYLNKF